MSQASGFGRATVRTGPMFFSSQGLSLIGVETHAKHRHVVQSEVAACVLCLHEGCLLFSAAEHILLRRSEHKL